MVMEQGGKEIAKVNSLPHIVNWSAKSWDVMGMASSSLYPVIIDFGHFLSLLFCYHHDYCFRYPDWSLVSLIPIIPLSLTDYGHVLFLHSALVIHILV